MRPSAARRPAIVLPALPYPMTKTSTVNSLFNNGSPFRVYAIGGRWTIGAPTMPFFLGTRPGQPLFA
ncbi:porin [Propionibacterium sp. HMSC068C01]|nr:porin [Propionibacterium sp. HMSC068C01]